MECPVCKRIFPDVEEVLMLVENSFYCHHCWSRLIYYSDREEGPCIEEDITGDKWRAMKGMASFLPKF
jgi:hypothetical protein